MTDHSRCSSADLDLDGDQDILTASRQDNKITWFENNGNPNPNFTHHAITTTATGAHSVYAADLDGDGDMDMISASQFDSTVAWYENTVDPPIVIAVISPNGGECFDNDSLIDVHWMTDVNLAGTAVNLEVWDDMGWVADLGTGWDPDGQQIQSIRLPLLPTGEDYRIRLTSV